MSEAPEFQLTTPDSVAADPQAIEILRMWWSKDEPVMSVKPAFNDPIKFGELLAYAARLGTRFSAQLLASLTGRDPVSTERSLRAAQSSSDRSAATSMGCGGILLSLPRPIMRRMRNLSRVL